jgi:hypothetical protein
MYRLSTCCGRPGGLLLFSKIALQAPSKTQYSDPVVYLWVLNFRMFLLRIGFRQDSGSMLVSRRG